METIKKEKKADLEQLLSKLLNDLLRMGWKPFNRDKTLHIDCYDKCKGLNYKWIHLDGGFMNEESRTLRELVSIDSGLWQFACENKLLAKGILDLPDVLWKRDSLACMRTDLRKSCYPHDYEYRLIESSLKDESELEDFLLNSISLHE